MDTDSGRDFSAKPSATEAVWACKIGVADLLALPEGGADAPLRSAVEQAFRELTGRDADFHFSGWGASLTEDEREAVAEQAQTLREIEAVKASEPSTGWQGEFPAKGTRRHAILEEINRHECRLYDGHGGKLVGANALDLADAIEKALQEVEAEPDHSGSPIFDALAVLDSLEIPRSSDRGPMLDIGERVTVLADQLVAARREVAKQEETIRTLSATINAQSDRLDQLRFTSPRLPAGTKALHVVLAPNPDADSPQMLFVEVEDQDGKSLGFPRLRDDDHLTRIVIPYGRDDAWVASLAHRIAGAVVAGEPSGVACRRLLEEVGVRSLCERHTEQELAKGVKSSPTDDQYIDEFTLVLLACERLHDRLTDGPIPNPAELARVIEILR